MDPVCDATVFLLKAGISDKTVKVPSFLLCWAVPESFFYFFLSSLTPVPVLTSVSLDSVCWCFFLFPFRKEQFTDLLSRWQPCLCLGVAGSAKGALISATSAHKNTLALSHNYFKHKRAAALAHLGCLALSWHFEEVVFLFLLVAPNPYHMASLLHFW